MSTYYKIILNIIKFTFVNIQHIAFKHKLFQLMNVVRFGHIDNPPPFQIIKLQNSKYYIILGLACLEQKSGTFKDFSRPVGTML